MNSMSLLQMKKYCASCIVYVSFTNESYIQKRIEKNKRITNDHSRCCKGCKEIAMMQRQQKVFFLVFDHKNPEIQINQD